MASARPDCEGDQLMIERVLTPSVQRRWLVVVLVMMTAAFGVWSLIRLPIDAVPDITNNQVQINTVAAALSPSESARSHTAVTMRPD